MSISLILFRVKRYILYWLYRTDQHSLQAPFIFDLYKSAFKKRYEIDQDILSLWKTLKLSDVSINHQAGAGSLSKIHSVSSIAQVGVTSPKNASLIYQFIGFFQSQNVLELGTSIGINSAIQSRNPSVNKLITVEGNVQLADLARQNLQKLGVKNAEVINEDVFDYLNHVKSPSFDMIFVDADHSYNAVIQYNQMLPELLNKGEGVIIYDDINWSPDMRRAWNEISQAFSHGLSLETYQFGILIYNQSLQNQHHVLNH